MYLLSFENEQKTDVNFTVGRTDGRLVNIVGRRSKIEGEDIRCSTRDEEEGLPVRRPAVSRRKVPRHAPLRREDDRSAQRDSDRISLRSPRRSATHTNWPICDRCSNAEESERSNVAATERQLSFSTKKIPNEITSKNPMEAKSTRADAKKGHRWETTSLPVTYQMRAAEHRVFFERSLKFFEFFSFQIDRLFHFFSLNRTKNVDRSTDERTRFFPPESE